MFSNTKPDDTNTEIREFPCPQPVTAIVRIGGGTVTVTAEDRPSAEVAVGPYDDSEASRKTAANTKVKFTGDRLLVETTDNSGGWSRRSGHIRVDLRVPLDSQLQAQTGSADIQTDGRLAEAVIHTGSGDIYVRTTAGDLAVESGSGDVRADEVGGSLRVSTASGDVSTTTVIGPVVVDVASGDVEIEEASGPVKASSASGNIHIAAARGGQIRLDSASGDVSVGVPTGTRVWLDLSTMSGSTASDLDMTAPAPEQGAQLNLQVRTMSGDISVHRVSAGSPVA